MRFHRFAFATLAAAGLSVGLGQVASAADMPVKAARGPIVTAYNWSGIYIGGDAGWQSSKIDLSRVDPPGTLTYSPRHSSFALGAFVGAQKQFGQFVLGIEGGYMSAFGDASLGATPVPNIFTVGGTGTAQAKLKDIWNIGGRVGWAMDRWMPYLTGGYASGAFQFNAQGVSASVTEQANATTGGYYIGVGIDWALTNNWILGAEYRHYGFSAKTAPGAFSTGGTENVRFGPSTDTVLARVSYKFDWMR
jgi:outer membrane immunogenic protein